MEERLARTVTDNEIRVELYESFVSTGNAPTAASVAARLGTSAADVEASLRRLAEGRVLVLQPGTTNLWMLNPLSAVETPFRVHAAGKRYFGNCIWDSLGIAAMLAVTAQIEARCPDCDAPLYLSVSRDAVDTSEDYVGHFAVPAARWWDDIGYT